MSLSKNIESLDSFIPVCYEQSQPASFKNLYMYVTAAQLSSILKDKSIKLSRTSRTNDSTENIAKNETAVRFAVEEYGYICLSASITSAMMWGQYADRGRGACLVFSAQLADRGYNDQLVVTRHINRKSASPPCDMNIIFHKVDYTSTRIAINNSPDLLERLLTTKSLDWEHEREYRILIPLNKIKKENIREEIQGDFSYTYLDDRLIPLLSRIVLGVNNASSILDMEKRVNNVFDTHYYPIRVTKASLDAETFTIVPNLDKANIPLRQGEQPPNDNIWFDNC